MQFYKERSFGELISDTVSFFKEYGRNFFKDYLMMTGGIVVLLVAVLAVGYGDFIRQFLAGNVGGERYLFGTYFAKNQDMLIISSLVALILIILLSLVCYSVPILYIKRVAENNTMKVTTSELIDDLKKNVMRLVQFFLGTTFIILPVALLAFIFSGILIFLFIGILMIMVLMPVATNIVNFTLFQMLNSRNNFFTALGKAFRYQFSRNFWKYTGSSLIVFMVIQMVSGVIMIVPSIFFYASLFTNPGVTDLESPDPFSFAGGFLFIIYLVSMTVTVLLMNIQYVNTGLMYYNSRSDLHRKVSFAEIDTIGTIEE